MSRLRFGTDGVRGKVNYTLKMEDVLALGLAHGYFMRTNNIKAERPRIVVGRDSRVSGDALLGAYGAGLMSQGVDLIDLGILPTPGVAYAVRYFKADGAAMISASHNPVADNGIKLFSNLGEKLDGEGAQELEALVGLKDEFQQVEGVGVGRKQDLALAARQAYHEFLLHNLEGSLKGLTIVVDCAYGAASGHAEEVFSRAGAHVIPLANVADGERINVGCGSTDLAFLQEAVLRYKADLGLAFDGDADRCLAVTERGQIITGDQMLVVLARYLKALGKLARDTVVLTVMSNLGSELALREAGIMVVRTQVGDRFVYEKMKSLGAALGGEQSGHILLLDRHWSGDGMLAGLVFAGVIANEGQTASSLIENIVEYPQMLINISGVDRERVASDPAVLAAIEKAKEELGPAGRLLVRPSGTEPLVRLMAEGSDRDRIDEVLKSLSEVVKRELAV